MWVPGFLKVAVGKRAAARVATRFPTFVIPVTVVSGPRRLQLMGHGERIVVSFRRPPGGVVRNASGLSTI
jgi:hypothetical protein